MSENLIKSLTDLIDETLAEVENLKKSRFDASCIDLADDKANGSMDTKAISKADDKDEDDKDEDKKEEKEEVEKAMIATKAEACKAEDKDEDDEDDMEDEEVQKAEAALKLAKEKVAMKKAEKKGINVEKADKMEEVKKSLDARISPIENQLTQLTNLVKKLADAPVAQRGKTFRDVQPLAKSNETESLNKSQVLDKLLDLKKSGKDVLTDDVIKVELGGMEDLSNIVNKYGIK